MTKSQQLAKRKLYRFMTKIDIESSAIVALAGREIF